MRPAVSCAGVTGAAAQLPATQLVPAPHGRPHAPQWALLARVLVSQPLLASPSQSPKPAAHVRWHAPATHAPRVLAVEAHARPHAPQCAALVCRSASQPLFGFSSQSARPPAQARERHTPAAQYSVVAQSLLPTQSTHSIRAVSQTWSSALHSRDETQARGGGTQVPSWQTDPPVQSFVLTQSTQRMRAVSQTCPGQVRELTHAVAATQRPPPHTLPSGQCALVTHAAQRPCARSQRGVAPPQARSLMHATAGAS
jgi:hypothetical protein